MQHRAEHRELQARGQRHGNDQGKRGSLVTRLGLEGGAAGAAVDVSARHAALQNHAVGRGDPLADVHARMIPGDPAASQRLPCLKDERLDLARSHSDDVRDLLVGVVAQLEQDERGSLLFRQPPDLVDHVAQILTALHQV